MGNFKNTLLLLCFVITFLSCKKDHSVLGVNVQPENDGVNATYCDTAAISAFTAIYDSIGSYNDSYKYLGSNQDPVFGRMDVGLYLNANVPDGVTFTTFGDDANLVSAEIILGVSSLSVVGSQLATLTYSVFGLDSALYNSRLYYTSSKLPYKFYNQNMLLAAVNASYTIYNGEIVLRIPIDNNYAKSILNNPQYLVDNGTFLNYYKGFYITSEGSNLNPVTAPGAISTFNLEDPVSGFYLHYQHGTPSASKQTIDYKFNFSGTNALRFNTAKFQPTNTYLVQQLQDSILAYKQNLFLKGMGATRVKIKIPFLDYLKNYSDTVPIAINRAELVFHVDPALTATLVGNNTTYYVPPKLALLPLDSLGRETYSVDQLSLTDFARYGGDYDEDNNRYVINIARHLQAILTKKRKNYGFHLVVANPDGAYVVRRDNYIERVILGGSDHPNTDLRPKFNVSFIKYKHDK